MHLSTHFTLQELIFSQTAVRRGIDNMPSSGQIERGEELCLTLLEPIRAHFGPVRVTSAYRCPEVNRLVGSKDTSAHIRFEAADIQTSARPLAVCRWIADSDLPFDQVINEYGQWTHVGIASPGSAPRRQCLSIDKYGTRLGLHEARP